MTVWDSILAFFRLPRLKKRRSFALDEHLVDFIEELADWEQRPPDRVANDLLSEALQRRRVTAESLLLWRKFSERERDVSALVCLGLTTAQISARLGITRETTKTHVTNILLKSELHSRQELRQIFTGWDFSAWE